LNYKDLCLCLADSENESGVIKHLQSAGFWDNPDCWQYFGNIEDNWSTIGNQQSSPQSALVEKLVNSVDAMLMAACIEAGFNPNSDKAPQSLIKALQDLFRIPQGRLSLIDVTERTKLAENIYLVATGAKSNPCYTVIDKGEGQSPNSMPDTILGLFKSIKKYQYSFIVAPRQDLELCFDFVQRFFFFG